jgi:hypothetical protein
LNNKRLKCLFIFISLNIIFCYKALAIPDKIEIWFVSPPRTGIISKKEFIKQYLRSIFVSSAYAKSEVIDYKDKGFRQVDDYYFHPQFGLYKPKEEVVEIKENKNVKKNDNKKSGVSIYEDNILECDPKNTFDLFCGGKIPKSSPKSNNDYQIWVDVSSSWRAVDESRDGECFRKSFIKRVRNKCEHINVGVYTYNTSKKQLGGLDNLCMNYGLNNSKTLVRWISKTKAKKLIVITDISEFDTTLSDFMDENSVKARGEVPGDEIFAKDIVNMFKIVNNNCKK